MARGAGRVDDSLVRLEMVSRAKDRMLRDRLGKGSSVVKVGSRPKLDKAVKRGSRVVANVLEVRGRVM